jgi:hypothetical protein
VYDITSLGSEHTLEIVLDKKYLMYGGLFDSYHAVQAELRQNANAKQYVAILSKKAVKKVSGKDFYPVHVVQVTDVVPNLRPQAFCFNDDMPRVLPDYKVHNIVELWFYAPVNLDREKIASSVLEGLGRWIGSAPGK